MAFRRRLARADASLREHDSHRKQSHALQQYAMFVRFMERWQLNDCVHYFSEDMTLAKLRHVTSRDLLSSYNVTDSCDRDRIMKVVADARLHDASDTEVSPSFSIPHNYPMCCSCFEEPLAISFVLRCEFFSSLLWSCPNSSSSPLPLFTFQSEAATSLAPPSGDSFFRNSG